MTPYAYYTGVYGDVTRHLLFLDNTTQTQALDLGLYMKSSMHRVPYV